LFIARDLLPSHIVMNGRLFSGMVSGLDAFSPYPL